jgi:predicted ATP-grasp superfamily ATP-dependent carboligase
MGDDSLLIVGASTRAAAFSALRAGLRPWCIDLFADRDLRRYCPAQRLRAGYPHEFLLRSEAAPDGPWMYTGALEGWPGLVAQLASRRPLWGCDADALRLVRDPWQLRRILGDAGLPCPALAEPGSVLPANQRWLLKPRRGAAGIGIRFWDGMLTPRDRRRPVLLQEYIEGEAVAAVYAADGRSACLLGATRQLTGAAWLHAAPFHYCGSLGPLPLADSLRSQLERLGPVLAAACGLRGVFGVDGIVREESFWPVEVNPRYTASMEVLEYAIGVSILGWHRAGCGGRLLASVGCQPPVYSPALVGKALLFARDDLELPSDGPWLADLQGSPTTEMPLHADIPAPGERIEAGQPIVTLLARGSTLEACEETLRQRAGDLDRRLFGR